MSDKDIVESKWEAFNQSSRVCRNWNLIARIDFSTPLKVLSFCSRQRHHMRQCGIIFQIFLALDLPRLPFQQLIRSITSRGITQKIPNKISIIFHNSRAIGQCISKWLTDSPLDLHIRHQSKMITLLFLRFSVVRIFPNAVVQMKNATLGGTLAWC